MIKNIFLPNNSTLQEFLIEFCDKRKLLTLSGLSIITGINQKQLSHYKSGLRNPNTKTLLVFKTLLYRFAKELENIQVY